MVLNGAAIDVSLIKNGRYGIKAQKTTTGEGDASKGKQVASVFRTSNSQRRNLKTLIKELKEQKMAQKLTLGNT